MSRISGAAVRCAAPGHRPRHRLTGTAGPRRPRCSARSARGSGGTATLQPGRKSVRMWL